MAGADYLCDGDSISSDVKIPIPITFYLKNLSVGCTITYHIDTIK